MAEPAKMRITLEPAGEFFSFEKSMGRAWTGTTETGAPVTALMCALQVGADEPGVEGLTAIPPPVPAWSPVLREVMVQVWQLAGRLSDNEATWLLSYVRSRALYRDDICIEQVCSHEGCGKTYRGPAMYCCYACAFEDR